MQKRYPFKFLDAYTSDDSAFYFGRDQEIAQMYEMIFQTDLLLVYGASGTGKTSLIQCGLASRFQSHEWLSLSIRRGNDINASLDKVLLDYGGKPKETDDNFDWLDNDWTQENTTTTKNTSELAKRLKAAYLRHFKPLYLIFDQFEELYILGNKEEQNIFFDTVKEILQLKQPIKIIISIREEYLGYLYEFECKVPELLRKKLRVEPMNYDRVKSVIHGVAKNPASIISLKQGEEDEIVSLVFAKIKGEGKKISIELPYLQVFLDKLYIASSGDESRTAETVFSLDILGTIGDIGDVLRNLLDEQVQLTAQKLLMKSDFIWEVLSPFVTLDGTKEPLSIEMLGTRLHNVQSDVLNQILQAFVNRRILRYSENEDLYEVAHDSLARQIHARRSDEEIALLEVQRLIKSQCSIKDEAREMFTPKQLAFIEPFVERLNLSPEEKKLIDESHIAEEKFKNEKAKRQRRIITLIGSAALISIALAMFGLTMWKKAEKQANIAKQQTENALKQEQNAHEARIKADILLRQITVTNFEKYFDKAVELAENRQFADALDQLNIAKDFATDTNEIIVVNKINEYMKIAGKEIKNNELLKKAQSLELNQANWLEAINVYQELYELGFDKALAEEKISLLENRIKQKLAEYKSNIDRFESGGDKNAMLNDWVLPALDICDPIKNKPYYDFYTEKKKEFKK